MADSVIRLHLDAEPSWYYVKVPADKLAAFEQNRSNDNFDVRDFGIILESAIGDFPPQDVIGFMEQEYGFVTPSKK